MPKKSETANKRDKPSGYWAIEYVLFIVVIVIAILLFNDVASFTHFICSREGPSQQQRAVYDMEILMTISIIAIAISTFLGFDSSKLFMLFSFMLIFWFIMAYLGALNPPCPRHCEFSAGITCTDVRLYPNGGLDLSIGQGIGYMMKITGVACVQNPSQDYINKVNINNYASDPITINPGEAKDISKLGTSHAAICTDANGNVMNITNGQYIGKLYINYTDVDNGAQRVAEGAFSALVYSPPSCWSDPFYCIVGMNDTIFPMLIGVWFLLGVYLFYTSNQPKE